MVLRQLRHCATKHNREKGRAVVDEDMIRWKQQVSKHVRTYYDHKLTVGSTDVVLRVCRYSVTQTLGPASRKYATFFTTTCSRCGMTLNDNFTVLIVKALRMSAGNNFTALSTQITLLPLPRRLHNRRCLSGSNFARKLWNGFAWNF